VTTVPDGLESRCAFTDDTVVACPDVRARLNRADQAAAYGFPLEAAALREAARHHQQVCFEVERGHRTHWGLAK
jgi:hypothetical protein